MKKIFLLLLFLSFSYCSSKTEKPIQERTLEGWAGHPDDPNKKPFDYYYMKSIGRASIAHLDRGKAIRYTCIDSIEYGLRGELVKKMINESIKTSCIFCNSSDTEIVKLVLSREYISFIKQEVKDCKPLGVPNPEIPFSEWKECECLLYTHIPDGRDAIIARAQKIDKD